MKLLIEVEKDYYEMIKYNVEHGQEYKPFEIIANGLPYEERPKGEWKTVEGIDGDEYYECSNCGEPWVLTAGTPKDNNMNFCPNCGAKMKGGAE